MTCPLPLKRPKWPEVADEITHFRRCGMSEIGALSRLGVVYGLRPGSIKKYSARYLPKENT